jgi:hypothetical protein
MNHYLFSGMKTDETDMVFFEMSDKRQTFLLGYSEPDAFARLLPPDDRQINRREDRQIYIPSRAHSEKTLMVLWQLRSGVVPVQSFLTSNRSLVRQ